MHAVLFLERLVSYPIAHLLAHGVGAIEKLHESHAPLDEPSGQQAIPGKASLDFVAVVHPIEFERRRALLAEVSDLRRAQLHPGGKFIAGNAREQLAVARMAGEVTIVKESQQIPGAGL